MSNRIWNGARILLFLVFVVLLASFGHSALRTRELAGQLAPGKIGSRHVLRVALISQERDNPFWRSIEAGAREEASGFGMEIQYAGPLRIDSLEQGRLVDKAVAEHVDALLVQGVGDTSYAAKIDRASALGIPVVTLDADEPGSRRIAYVGTDNKLAGEAMGRLVVQTAGEEGSVGVVLGSEAGNQQDRLAGFRIVLDRYPNLTVADVRLSGISRLQAARQAETMLAAHPGLTAIVGFSALDGLGIAEAVQRVGAGSSVFAFDAVDETREAIAQGRIAASVVQKPEEMGRLAVRLLHGYLHGENVGGLHYTGTGLLDRASLLSGESTAAAPVAKVVR